MNKDLIHSKLLSGDYNNRFSPNNDFTSFMDMIYFKGSSPHFIFNLDDFKETVEDVRIEGKDIRVTTITPKNKYINSGNFKDEFFINIDELMDLPLFNDNEYLTGTEKLLNAALSELYHKDNDNIRVRRLLKKIKELQHLKTIEDNRTDTSKEYFDELRITLRFEELLKTKLDKRDHYFKDDHKYGKSNFKFIMSLVKILLKAKDLLDDIETFKSKYQLNLIIEANRLHIEKHFIPDLVERIHKHYSEFYNSTIYMKIDDNIENVDRLYKAIGELAVIYNYMIYKINIPDIKDFKFENPSIIDDTIKQREEFRGNVISFNNYVKEVTEWVERDTNKHLNLYLDNDITPSSFISDINIKLKYLTDILRGVDSMSLFSEVYNIRKNVISKLNIMKESVMGEIKANKRGTGDNYLLSSFNHYNRIIKNMIEKYFYVPHAFDGTVDEAIKRFNLVNDYSMKELSEDFIYLNDLIAGSTEELVTEELANLRNVVSKLMSQYIRNNLEGGLV